MAVLSETTAAGRALCAAQARCYRALSAIAESDVLGETGYRNLGRLLEDHVRVDPAETRRLARQARALRVSVSPTGAEVPAALPGTARAVDDAQIGPGHVEIIRSALDRLAAVVPALAPNVLATAEAELPGWPAAIARSRWPRTR